MTRVRENHGDMISEVRYQLDELAHTAAKVASTLGEGGRPANRREREVIKMAVDSKIHSLMDEATYFALQGDLDDMEKDMEHAKDWAMFKMDI